MGKFAAFLNRNLWSKALTQMKYHRQKQAKPQPPNEVPRSLGAAQCYGLFVLPHIACSLAPAACCLWRAATASGMASLGSNFLSELCFFCLECTKVGHLWREVSSFAALNCDRRRSVGWCRETSDWVRVKTPQCRPVHTLWEHCLRLRSLTWVLAVGCWKSKRPRST